MKNFFDKVGSAEIRNIIALVCVIGVLGLLYLLAFKPIPKENNELMYMAVGQVLALGFGVVLGYFFGASKDNNNSKKDTQ